MVGKQKAAVNPVAMAEGIWHSPAIRKISVQAVFFMVGLLCSRGIVFGRYAPFGVAVIAAALKHFEKEKEAASRATTLPVVGESLWKYYGKLQMTANNY